MKRIINYIIAYATWVIDLVLGIWVISLTRTTILDIFALFYKNGNWQYTQMVNFLDKVFVLLLGLVWLAFMIFAEEYFRGGIYKGNLVKRIAKINGPVLLIAFCIDLILFWLQGIGNRDWLRWLILASELGLGLTFIVYAKTGFTKKSI